MLAQRLKVIVQAEQRLWVQDDAPNSSIVSDGVDAPTRRHRNVPVWRCFESPNKEGSIHEEGYHCRR